MNDDDDDDENGEKTFFIHFICCHYEKSDGPQFRLTYLLYTDKPFVTR